MKINQAGLVTVMWVAVLTGCGQAGQESGITTQPSNTSQTSTTPTSEANAGGEVYEGTISGVISDSMCGADHTKMGEMGKDPASCARKCVESGAKYILVDGSGGFYQLTDQDKAKELAGKSVSIEGHIDPKEKSIHVHSIHAQ